MVVRARSSCLLSWTVLASGLLLWSGCGQPPALADVVTDIASDMSPEVRPHFEAGADVTLQGRNCSRSSQCDDQIDCTEDICGSDNRCVNLPNAARCDDSVFCNGTETCDMRRGCMRGEPMACNDNQTCTADRCNEMTRLCEHSPLDRDGDGDPDNHCMASACGDAGVPEPDTGVITPCWRGGDCDDRNASVSSRLPEICGDMVDNNCNGFIDAMEPGGCRNAPYDTCMDPLDVSAGGVFSFDLSPARGDYSLRCAGRQAHDVVARLTLTAPRDITLEGSSASTSVGLSLQTVCGAPSDAGMPELDCNLGFPAIIRRHSLPAGTYFIVVALSASARADLTVRLSDPTPAATNDTCATPITIPDPGGTYRGDLIGVADDVNTTCGGTARDVVYTFTLADTRDVSLMLAAGRSDFVNLSLTRTCARMPDMVRCDSGSTVSFTAHQLPAGTYFVIVESFNPVNYTLQATFSAPTPPAPGDTCADPLMLTTSAPTRVSTAPLENDYRLTCGTSGRDVVLRFDITTRRDVLVTVRGATSDFFSAALLSDCAARPTERTCLTGSSPRLFGLALDPGTYFVIVKSFRPADFDVTLETFAPLTVTNVTVDNDTCTSAYAIPPGRGAFRGSTATLRHEYNAPCAGMTGGKDAVFSLHLAARQRVTLVNNTTWFHAMWIATNTGSCPGTPPMVTGSTTCTLGNRTTLDVTLDPGDYWIFIDGFFVGAEGTYDLLVHLSPP